MTNKKGGTLYNTSNAESTQTKRGGTLYKDIKNIKRQRDKDISDLPISMCPTSSSAASSTCSAPEALPSGSLLPLTCGSVTPQPKSLNENIIGMYISYFQNPGKYKNVLRMRVNLADNHNVAFLAFMSDRWATFTREADDDAKEWVKLMRQYIKDEYNTKTYMGKILIEKGKKSSIEPGAAAVLWWDREKELWCAAVRIHDFEHAIVLEDEFLTEKQKASNIRATALYRKYNSKKGKSWLEENGYI